MGNLIYYPNQNATRTVTHKVDICFKFLCNCKRNIGSKPEISKLYKNYLSFQFGKSFFLVKSELRRIANLTRIEGYEDLVFSYFTIKSSYKINFMELFAAIITYSETL